MADKSYKTEGSPVDSVSRGNTRSINENKVNHKVTMNKSTGACYNREIKPGTKLLIFSYLVSHMKLLAILAYFTLSKIYTANFGRCVPFLCYLLVFITLGSDYHYHTYSDPNFFKIGN